MNACLFKEEVPLPNSQVIQGKVQEERTEEVLIPSLTHCQNKHPNSVVVPHSNCLKVTLGNRKFKTEF